VNPQLVGGAYPILDMTMLLTACLAFLPMVQGESPVAGVVNSLPQASGVIIRPQSGVAFQVPPMQQVQVPVVVAPKADASIHTNIPVSEGTPVQQNKVPVLSPQEANSAPSASAIWWLSVSSWSPTLARVLAGISFAAVVKALCMAGNVLVQVSPFPQVKRWEHRRCTGEADAAPYVSIAFGGWQWCYYGMFAWLVTKRSGFLILVHSNFLGALLGTYYTFTFFRNCRNEESSNKLHRYLSAVGSLALLQVCAIMVLPAERALFLTGLVSSFCSFVGAISMMVTLPTVIRTQDSRSIPGPLVTAYFFSACVWCLCGWILADPLIMSPNIASCLASAACLYLKMKYPTDATDAKGTELDDPSVNTCTISHMSQKGAKLACADLNEFTPMKLAEQGAPQEVPSYAACTQYEDGTGGTC